MDRLSSAQLLHSDANRRVTRLRMKEIRRVFPFLSLPAELRCLIYTCTIDLKGLRNFEAWFDTYYLRFLAAKGGCRLPALPGRPMKRSSAVTAPVNKAPNLFLINKQIFHEAAYLFYRNQHISFDHGILGFSQISEIISLDVLLQLSSISITDSGHGLIMGRHTGDLPHSWNGYIRLLEQLGTLLSTEEHKLQKLTIDFKDPALEEHMVSCWEGEHQCGFRDQMRRAIDTFRDVRGVKSVTLNGLNPDHARQLKTRMQSEVVEFSALPKNARELIYSYALNWGGISNSIMRAVADWPDKTKPFPYPTLTTPSILLLNKQYSTEALSVLAKEKQILALDLPDHHSITHKFRMPALSKFISCSTLRTISTLSLKMECWDWLNSLDSAFLMVLEFSPALKAFSLNFTDEQKYRQSVYPDHCLETALKRLLAIRGLESATFSGDLPICFTDPMAAIMTSRTRFQPECIVERDGVPMWELQKE